MSGQRLRADEADRCAAWGSGLSPAAPSGLASALRPARSWTKHFRPGRNWTRVTANPDRGGYADVAGASGPRAGPRNPLVIVIGSPTWVTEVVVRPDEVVHVGDRSLALSRLGLGTAWLGNMDTAVADASATAIVRQALEAGIRMIDTAPLYGYGLAEDRLGTALTGVRRDAFILGTKVGRVLRPRAPGDPAPRSYDGTQGPGIVDVAVI